MSSAMISGVLTMIVVLTVVVWFDLRCLADLSQSPTPRLLTRQAWALLILITFPLGGILYLVYGKRR
jgi:hypothetical protein